jgi:methyl-accepting chemotaxis protein/sigma-B regulation protein RsbU (phosphoserine phosphatase)
MVFAVALLLTATLAVTFIFSRQAMKKEAMNDASHALETTARHIDNILLSVEQTAGNVYYDLMRHRDEPETMEEFCTRVVTCNPYVTGCATAFKPDYFKAGESMMVYVYKDGGKLVTTHKFGVTPYTEQPWYVEPVTTGRVCWLEPLKNKQDWKFPLVTFCLPIYGKDRSCVGVLGIDVPLVHFTKIVNDAKPSPNGYITLLSDDGSYIVHPNYDKLYRQTVFTQIEHGADPSVREAAEAMISGESGFKPFILDHQKWYVMYKPFQRQAVPGRVMEELKWSVGVVYPEQDIFGAYNRLLYYLLAIIIVGFLVFFILCRWVTHRQLLPLEGLTDSVRRIAQGNYDETIPDTNRQDEIGQLQRNFQQMQQSLAAYIGEQEKLSADLQARHKELEVAYRQAKEADRMKTAFLHNMTNQMVPPSNQISDFVKRLCQGHAGTAETGRLAKDIEKQSKVIVELLDDMIQTADDEKGKEVDDE